jgi:hypothetical protein
MSTALEPENTFSYLMSEKFMFDTIASVTPEETITKNINFSTISRHKINQELSITRYKRNNHLAKY